MWRFAAAALVALFVTSSAGAQTPTGTILGSVKDTQGAVVPGATVTATNLGTQYSRSAVTDGAGEYALRLLPVGNYQVVDQPCPGSRTTPRPASCSKSAAMPGSTRPSSSAR